jgi:hypothetical protein
MMEIVSLLANQRGVDEQYVMENYTYRQIEHIAGAYMKDRTMVVRMLAGAFTGGNKSDEAVEVDGAEQPKKKKVRTKVVSKFSPVSAIPSGSPVIDLDGPLEKMAGWVGGVQPGGKVVGGKKGSVGGIGKKGMDSLDQMADNRWKGKPRGND